MNREIEIESGTAVRLLTAGKYCDRDIVITAKGGAAANPVIQPIEITENGTYTAPNGVDGYSPISVQVPAGGGELPEGYRRCDYIQFLGGAFVDTGIIGTHETQIWATFTWESSVQRHLFGCASADNTKSITSYMNGSWRFGNKNASKSIGSKNPLLPYAALVNKTTIAVTNAISAISDVNEFETVGTLLLGGARDSDGTLPGVGITGKVFNFCVWESEKLALKLIPVTDGTVFRFWDDIGKKFHDSVSAIALSGGDL